MSSVGCGRCGRALEEWPCNEDGSDYVDPSGHTYPLRTDDGRLVTGWADQIAAAYNAILGRGEEAEGRDVALNEAIDPSSVTMKVGRDIKPFTAVRAAIYDPDTGIETEVGSPDFTYATSGSWSSESPKTARDALVNRYVEGELTFSMLLDAVESSTLAQVRAAILREFDNANETDALYLGIVMDTLDVLVSERTSTAT